MKIFRVVFLVLIIAGIPLATGMISSWGTYQDPSVSADRNGRKVQEMQDKVDKMIEDVQLINNKSRIKAKEPPLMGKVP